MGQIFSSLWTALFASKELKIVMVGACHKMECKHPGGDIPVLTGPRCWYQQLLELTCMAAGAR